VIRSEIARIPDGDPYYARPEWDAAVTGHASTRQLLQRVEDEVDRCEAGNALPRVLPRAIVEAIQRLAADAQKSPSAMVEQATNVWKADGTPCVNVPASVEAVCVDLSAGAVAYVRVMYQAIAWWLASLGVGRIDSKPDPSDRA
jgi:hypothetical protein